MDADPWARFASKRHQSSFQSRFDPYLGFEELDGGEDESRSDFPCPFCNEDFDVLGLFCHIDDVHPVEAKNGICPVCTARVGLDMVAHMTTQHGSFFKMQRRRILHRGSSSSHLQLSFLRKELQQGNLRAFLGDPLYAATSSHAAADSLLSPFVLDMSGADSSKEVQFQAFDEGGVVETGKSSDEIVVESVEPSLSGKDQQERAQRSEFVLELVLSTVFRDI